MLAQMHMYIYIYIYIHTHTHTYTHVGGIEAFHFSISNELEQIIKHPTRVPDCHDHAANTLDLFFASNPQNYTKAGLPLAIFHLATLI